LLQKKNLEARLENIRASLLNIEALTNKIEQASVNGVGLQALKSGKDVLQVVNRNADIDQIEDVMDDIRDLVDEVAEADERVAAGAQFITHTILDLIEFVMCLGV
jgi:urease gamma subunit